MLHDNLMRRLITFDLTIESHSNLVSVDSKFGNILDQ
jgi:hypothetical protein